MAALYDVHGNLPALEAALGEVAAERVDAIVAGGDIASGPMPVGTLDLLRAAGATCVRGNADRVLDFEGGAAGPREVWQQARVWVAERLGEERLAFLAGLPLDAVLDVDGLGAVRFCHGAPGSDTLTITRLTPDATLRSLLENTEERVVVCGHTHVQFDRRVDDRRVVNAGSVGFPYEARAGAYWALLGPDVSFRRTPYDVDAAARLIRATGYPRADWIAEEIVLEDPERPARMSALIEGLP